MALDGASSGTLSILGRYFCLADPFLEGFQPSIRPSGNIYEFIYFMLTEHLSSHLPENHSPPILEVISGGLETTVQDGFKRTGHMQWGIPQSGPLDLKSLALGNHVLGNDERAAGLEIQLIGPTLRCLTHTLIAITGADNHPQLNQQPLPLWQPVLVKPGDILSFGHADLGARTYVTVAGGLDVPMVMGSRSTFIPGYLGGLQGRALQKGDILSAFLPYLPLEQLRHRQLPVTWIPEFSREWQIDIILGPHDDWFTESDLELILATHWSVSPKSNRMGYRLEGPSVEFSQKAHLNALAHGGHPSNTTDYGCPPGAVLFCGQTPTILLADGPSLTGYVTPFTVVEASLRKVGQARPGDRVQFRLAKEHLTPLRTAVWGECNVPV